MGPHGGHFWTSQVLIILVLVCVGSVGANGSILTSLSRFFVFFFQLFYKTPPPQALMSTPQMITSNGFPVEVHKVPTADGYILTVFRIPPSPRNTDDRQTTGETRKGRLPVVLMHGDASSSNDWLLLPFDVALPYVLASRGHDVWLPNYRGNNYSMEHQSLTPDDSKFWDFCYDDIAIYDVPAVINYVLRKTKMARLNWVGHSGGTTVFFMAMAMDPNGTLNYKVHKMVALAPCILTAHSFGRVSRILSRVPRAALLEFRQSAAGGRLIPTKIDKLLKRYAPYICYGDISRELCQSIIYLIGGYNPSQMTKETASLISGHTPSDTSVKLIHQFLQALKAGRFKRFDYGPEKNRQLYGSQNPPDFDLSKVQVRVQGWCARNDGGVNYQDAMGTLSELGNLEETVDVGDPGWTHLDFVYGKDARYYIYDKIAAYFERS